MDFVLELKRSVEGVVRAHSADPQDEFEVYRLKRTRIKNAPAVAGVYFLLGHGSKGEPRVYIGKSETDIRKRIGLHRKDPNKEFFGEVFVFPISDTVYCRAVESEFIQRATEADNAVVLANVQEEKYSRGAHPAATLALCQKIQTTLEMLWGEDVFSEEAAALPESDAGGNSKRVGVTIAELLEKDLLTKGETLFAPVGERTATITPDGTIEMDGEEFTSLSAAAGVVNSAEGRSESVNGWKFWEVARDGGRTKLTHLRPPSESLPGSTET